MTPLAKAFLNQEQWQNFERVDSHFDLGQEIYHGANFRNQDFDSLLARGCTFNNSYFTNCTFTSCDFSNSAFSGCTFEECKFINCEFDEFILEETKCVIVEFIACTAKEISIQGGSLERCGFRKCNFSSFTCMGTSKFGATFEDSHDAQFDFEKSMETSINFEQCRHVKLTTKINALDISASSSTFKKMAILACPASSIKLRDSELLEINFDGPDRSLIIHAYSSLIFRPDLKKVNLSGSTFGGCSIVEGIWPNQEGKTNLLGRFVPPENLLGAPVDDVMGVSDFVKRRISRSQALISLEQRTGIPFFLHRFVGLTTGHGRDPIRLVLFSFFPAVILTGLHGVANHLFGPFNGVENPASLMEYLGLILKYYSLVVGYGDRNNLDLLPSLETTAWVFGVLFLGLVVTLFSNSIFRQN